MKPEGVRSLGADKGAVLPDHILNLKKKYMYVICLYEFK